MCGIAGIVGISDKDNGQTQIKRMTDVIRHRGPDGHGVWSAPEENLYLGHQRLSIIDLSEYASQPMISVDGRFVIVYNGEIYNYKELRKECEGKGSVFKSQSDTEVIFEAYRHWKTEIFNRFRGMWAFALYDNVEKKLILSRDPFGIKPLYYGDINGILYFASEPKAFRILHSAFETPDEISIRLFEEYGCLERGPWTFYRNIKRFPHAHFSIIDLQKKYLPLEFFRYWSPPTQLLKMSWGEAAEELKTLLQKSIRFHLRSDVPIGACLSGGIDSSAIVCIGTSYLPSGSQFNTFTTRYPEFQEIDETKWAQKIINFVNAKARFAEPTLQSFLQDFDHVIYYQDEPYGSTSIYAQYSIFKEISKSKVKVILDGQGADEQLAGYHGFLEKYLFYLVSQKRWMTFLIEGIYLHKFLAPPLLYLKDRIYYLLNRILKAPRNFSDKCNPKICADELESRLKEMQLPEDNFEQLLRNLTLETNLPQLLRYEDRNSMAFSIESRVPFLEPELVNFTLSLPSEFKIRRGMTKAVLREGLKKIIPEEIRTRRDKLGFPAPESNWLKEGFNLDVNQPGQVEWRQLIVKKWLEQLGKRMIC